MSNNNDYSWKPGDNSSINFLKVDGKEIRTESENNGTGLSMEIQVGKSDIYVHTAGFEDDKSSSLTHGITVDGQTIVVHSEVDQDGNMKQTGLFVDQNGGVEFRDLTSENVTDTFVYKPEDVEKEEIGPTIEINFDNTGSGPDNGSEIGGEITFENGFEATFENGFEANEFSGGGGGGGGGTLETEFSNASE